MYLTLRYNISGVHKYFATQYPVDYTIMVKLATKTTLEDIINILEAAAIYAKIPIYMWKCGPLIVVLFGKI